MTVKPGYKNPFLIHYGETIEMSETIRGDFFTARIISQTSSRMIIHIKADDIVNRIDSDAIYVRAVLANVDYGMTRSTAEPLGATIVITVYPN